MGEPIDRRRLLGWLGAGAGLAAGSAILQACGGAGAATSDGNPDMTLIPNDWDYLSGSNYRLAILLVGKSGAPLTLTGPVTIQVGRDKGPLAAAIPMALHTQGTGPNYALASYDFPSPGTYDLRAHYKGRSATTPISVIPPSQSATPVVGGRMISVPTPTFADHLGVNPVCTQQPACPFHQVSLDQVLAAHRPVALVFATPALCQSRFCGPVLSGVQSVSSGWTDRVTFIHCEIYTDLTGNTDTKPVQAYGLQHEPMMYLAGGDGIIRVRIDNLFDPAEARSALTEAYGPAS